MPYHDDPVSEADVLPQAPPAPGDVAGTGSVAAVSAAVQRFQSCRWRRPAENGLPECCAHRDVLPLTGAHGFDAEAWCTDCRFYKLRRAPKKRTATEDAYWRP